MKQVIQGAIMPNEPENLTLVYLRRPDEKMDRIGDDLRDLNVRMPAVEKHVAGVQRRIDRLDMPVERIEKRLDLVDHS